MSKQLKSKLRAAVRKLVQAEIDNHNKGSQMPQYWAEIEQELKTARKELKNLIDALVSE